MKASVRASDAILIVTPEYNQSIPGALKNALDWASRPYGDNAFAGKPAGIIGASVAAAGTAMAQQHPRNVLAYLDAPTMAQREVFIQYTDDRFAEGGIVVEGSTREFLSTWLGAFGAWVQLLLTARPSPPTYQPTSTAARAGPRNCGMTWRLRRLPPSGAGANNHHRPARPSLRLTAAATSEPRTLGVKPQPRSRANRPADHVPRQARKTLRHIWRSCGSPTRRWPRLAAVTIRTGAVSRHARCQRSAGAPPHYSGLPTSAAPHTRHPRRTGRWPGSATYRRPTATS